MKTGFSRGACVIAGMALATALHAQDGLDDLLGAEQEASTIETVDTIPVESVQVQQPEEKEVTRSAPRSRLVEEIVVTAQKREQDLQEVPLSVNAFSGAQLDAQGVRDIKDLQLVTPGLQYDSMASYSLIFIRGIGSDGFQSAADSSVATYIDGLYIPFTTQSAQALGDVRQVEVLKGPQGTIFGRNAIGGAISVMLKEPDQEAWGGEVLQEFGNYNAMRTKLSVSGPLGDTLAVSLAGLYSRRDSTMHNYVDPSKDYIVTQNVGVRGAVKWSPSDDFDFLISYYDLDSRGADDVITQLLEVAPLFRAVGTPHNVPHESGNHEGVGVFSRTKITNITMESRAIPWFDLKAVYGNIDFRSDIVFEYDSFEEPVLDISALPNLAKSDSIELIFNSNSEVTPDWLQWTGGLYYESSSKPGRYEVKVDALAIGCQLLNPSLGITLEFLEQLLNNLNLGLFDCAASNVGNKNPLVEAAMNSAVDTEAMAAYGQLTFFVTDTVSLQMGGRFARETRELAYSTVTANVLDVPIIGDIFGDLIPGMDNGLAAVSFNPQKHTWNSFTPNAGVNWQITPDIMVYLRYAEAFKSGNYNGLSLIKTPDRVEPELAASKEIGVKSKMFDGRVTANMSIFTTQMTNAQVQNLALTSGGVINLFNAASYKVEGAEFELSWFPIDSLAFGITGVYLKGRYGEFVGQGFDPAPPFFGLSRMNIDFSGNTTVRTPEFTGTTYFNWTFPLLWELEGELGGDIYYNSGFFYEPLNTVTADAYKIINARFGIYDPQHDVRVTFWGKNLTDDVFFTQKYRHDFGVTGIYGAPRTYGVTVSWQFGH
ncbi:TonB-dependent receptor [Sinimarinibacterium sp. NLF-5-8]|uniref:TonB-dependent receptor n=1 Tax=Sinimarinibacterium sp. NLF-5-8 TaxID=2698684 RepID=UPI00137BCFF3|nr:TonB-dependent receptor [Sinimarinibacterium sp. NLF-5-8]QHS10291.1 TonB-dependent receptor [Sinimarinibacterium sp. NLF-5-8]